MKIAVLSDTHNNIANLDAALERIRQEDVHTLIHCGDMTSAETASRMAGWRVICVFGNCDVASGEIREKLQELHPQSSAELTFTGYLGGARIAVTHGHIPGQMEELIESRLHEYVFHGHSHRQRDVRIRDTRVINPGALGGMHREPRQFCLLDLSTGKAEFIHL